MASATKLKQSSLHSFLLPIPNTSTTPNPTAAAPNSNPTSPTTNTNHDLNDSTPTAASDYEQARQENIRRNQDFLNKLGIAALLPSAPKVPSLPAKRKQHKTQSPLPAPSSLPLRRSTRRRSHSTPLSPEAHRETVEEPAPVYVDSSVLQYTCDAPKATSFAPFSSSSSPILGFEIAGKTMRDSSLTKIYTMDVSPLKGTRVLVVAGGHGGIISIFGGEYEEEGENGDGCGNDTERVVEGPLMSWKGSRSWISGVFFVKDNPTLLVSSSNDGGIVVWNTSKQPSLLSQSSWSPPVVADLKGLHSSGIFSMDMKNCSVVSASKDSSVGISRITMAGELVVERSISGHHAGVIRGVCFGEATDRLADCGADGRICVLDTRLPEPCALTIESTHSSGVNNIEWCPSNNFLLLSASKDPTLLLYDVRQSAEPLHKLQGHVESNSKTCTQIYRPTFMDNGMTIATPGPGSKRISMYRVDTGKLFSQGVVDYNPNLVFFTVEALDYPGLWTAGKQINQLCPCKFQQ